MAEVIVSGPLFDGRADAAVTAWLDDTKKDLASTAADMLRAFPMDKTGRARGGFQSNINAVSRGPDQVITGPTIRGVAWTPWLEGTSQRNNSTRFKGYRLFRQTAAELSLHVKPVAEEKLPPYIEAMGGHV